MWAEASFLLTVTMKQQTRVVSVRIGDLQRNLKLTCNKLAIYGYAACKSFIRFFWLETVCKRDSANHLAKVETGNRCCSIELLQDLSSCLNVRTDYLLNGDAPHNNHLRERLTFLAQELEKITADLPVWG